MVSIPDDARSLLGILQLETTMAAVAARGVRKRGPAAFVSAIQRIGVLTRQLEAIADKLSSSESQLSLAIKETALPRSKDGSQGLGKEDE